MIDEITCGADFVFNHMGFARQDTQESVAQKIDTMLADDRVDGDALIEALGKIAESFPLQFAEIKDGVDRLYQKYMARGILENMRVIGIQ